MSLVGIPADEGADQERAHEGGTPMFTGQMVATTNIAQSA